MLNTCRGIAATVPADAQETPPVTLPAAPADNLAA
jgi:hypothetical protein